MESFSVRIEQSTRQVLTNGDFTIRQDITGNGLYHLFRGSSWIDGDYETLAAVMTDIKSKVNQVNRYHTPYLYGKTVFVYEPHYTFNRWINRFDLAACRYRVLSRVVGCGVDIEYTGTLGECWRYLAKQRGQ